MRLRFAVGPVQELVRQSRRTRDLWASSFLLSYLSGCAMHGAAQHGKILLPAVDDDPLFQRIATGSSAAVPTIGSLPNRFELETDDPIAAAQSARTMLLSSWVRITSAVWQQHLEQIVSKGSGTKAIFRRQVESFWEIQWVAAEAHELGGLLEGRKAWRSRVPSTEFGDKCVVMPELQELSGFVRARSHREAEHQRAFWRSLKEASSLHASELRLNERLSAIALIKRLYPRAETATLALGFSPPVVNWRSTVYVAAKPWIDEALQREPAICGRYVDAVRRLDKRLLRESAERFSIPNPSDRSQVFRFLDGNYFFIDAVANEDATLEGINETDPQRQEVMDHLLTLYKSGGTSPLGPPATSYAILLMDGDRVGQLLSLLGGLEVSQRLATFTKGVAKIVTRHQGYTIYAGGDDVLAMLPIPSALACAWELREAYRVSFQGTSATTSAGVVFAHIRQPLSRVLEEAHRLLDDVAKEQNGRDSVAVSVLRRGDRALEWASTWDEPKGGAPRIQALQELANMWKGKTERHRAGETADLVPGELSTGLVYRLRELMGLLCGWPAWEPGLSASITGGNALALFTAEIRRSRRAAGLEDVEGDGANDESACQGEAERLARLLLRVSHPIRNDLHSGATLHEDRLVMDGALLSRFLASGGREFDHGAMEASR